MRSIPQTLNVPSFSLSWGLNYDDNDGNAKNYYCQHAFGVSRVPGAILSTLRALFELKLNLFKWDCYYPHVTGEETEPQTKEGISPR